MTQTTAAVSALSDDAIDRLKFALEYQRTLDRLAYKREGILELKSALYAELRELDEELEGIQQQSRETFDLFREAVEAAQQEGATPEDIEEALEG